MNNTKRAITFTILLTFTAILSGCISWLVPEPEQQLIKLRGGTYKLDPAHATLLFKVKHMNLSTYVGRFNQFDASLDFTPENMAASRLQGVVDMASIDVNNPDLADSLRGSTWLDSHAYPQAIFTTEHVIPLSDTRFQFTGQLSWRDQQHPATMIGEFHGGATNALTGKYTLGFSAKGQFARSTFGVDSYIPLVGDDVEIEIYAEFQRQ